MQSMHRQFGRLMKRSADDTKVSVLLSDFDNADTLLAKLIESFGSWRDAWTAILTYQTRLVQEFESMYNPIIGSSSSEPAPRPPAITPEETLSRTTRLNEEYEQLKTELLAEVNMVDERMIKPAMDAKDHLQPLKKVMKKREDKKLDFERYQNRVDTYKKKTKRSDRDNASMAKAESDLTKATEEYTAADDHLRSHLPGLLAAVFSLLPYLLHAQIEIQNTLLSLYYTTLHNYCEEQGLPSPPPPMEVVIQEWEQEVQPPQREIEAIACLAQGRQSRRSRTSDEHKNGSNNNTNGAGTRRVSSHSMGRKPSASPVRTLRAPSPGATTTTNDSRTRPNGIHSPQPATSTLSPSLYQTPSSSTTSSEHSEPSHAHSRPGLSPQQRHSSASSASTVSPVMTSNVANMAAAAAAKKKPPPPPAPRTGSSAPAHYVTAHYDFGGEGAGDLAFREGDRIRVVKKTDSTDDWWEGELRGCKGSFPANYCS